MKFGAIVVFGVVLSTRLHLIIATLAIFNVLICVVCVRIKLLQGTCSSSVFVAESALPAVVVLVVIIRLIRVMTLLMHHLPRSLQPTVSYLLLGIELLSFAHRRLLLFLHFKHLFLVL